MMVTYRTFKRSARNFEEFARANKEEQDSGLDYHEAREQCEEFNRNRTPAQIKRGTKLEFEEE
jgi:hypothetical protein